MALLRSARRHVQKKSAHATEQQRPDVLKRRADWFEGQPDLDPTKLVFIDETGASTNLARKAGRCQRGRRLRAAVPHGHYKTVTLVAGLSLGEVQSLRSPHQCCPLRGMGRRLLG